MKSNKTKTPEVTGKIIDRKYQLSTYRYNLPEKLIAQEPLIRRDEARLLVVNRKEKRLIHTKFKNIIEYLKLGDVLVLNESRVVKARLFGRKLIDGNPSAHVEVFILRKTEELNGYSLYKAMVKPGKRLKKGAQVLVGNEIFEVIDINEDGTRILKTSLSDKKFLQFLDKHGEVPLPPYIESQTGAGKYQTVFAKIPGSSAAPTAGMHFTPELLKRLESRGVIILRIVLHTGMGTFRPVKSFDIRNHVMDEEEYYISEDVAGKLEIALKNKQRIIACGTTTVRTLESAYKNGKFNKGWHRTSLFIYPTYKFRVVNALITNFHFSESTLIMLVSAFMGNKLREYTYNEAIRCGYRFLSFGDAMYIM